MMDAHLPGLAEQLGVELEVRPGWLGAMGRAVVGRQSLHEVVQASASPEELRRSVGALSVQEPYAARCRAMLSRFLVFVQSERARGAAGGVPVLVARFLAHVLRTCRVRRSTTVRAYAVAVTRCWPSAFRAPAIQEFLRGVEHLSPVLPDAAGVVVPRRVSFPAVLEWMKTAMTLNGGWSVAVVTGLLAGLRLREAARLLVTEGRKAFAVSREGVVEWREWSGTKSNMRGARYLVSRTAVVPREVAVMLDGLVLPWAATDWEVRRVLASTVVALAQVGVVDVRVFRRATAVGVRDAMATLGESEESAVGWARRVLGHRPGSAVTERYLGGCVSPAGRAVMRRVQTALQSGGRQSL